MRSLKINTGGPFLLLIFMLTCAFYTSGQAQNRSSPGKAEEKTEEPKSGLELSRAVRPWEFVSATGTRAALFGNEAGRLEAWVYPLKILRDFHLRFHLRSLDIPA